MRPERLTNPREKYRRDWWIHAEPRAKVRGALGGLARFVVTSRTARHRTFQFLDASYLPESKALIIGFDDAFHFGVLCSRIHVVFANAAGGWLGVGNDSTYNHSDCFDPFPFPACNETAKARIRALGEELDAHRKRVQAQHPGLSLTAMYNVLEALRAGRALTAKEQATRDAGLVSVLRQLHDELDAAVAAAYGWNDLWQWLDEAQTGTLRDFKTGTTAQLTATPKAFDEALNAWQREFDGEILRRLVALNAERAAEEARGQIRRGQIRWLRPEYQTRNSERGTRNEQTALALPHSRPTSALRVPRSKLPWPKTLAERVAAVERALAATSAPVTAAQLAKHFLRAKSADLAEILETLATLGRAHRDGESFSA